MAMASSSSFSLFAISLHLLALLPCALSDLAADQAECTSRLPSLLSCAPYVQGLLPSPAKSCCDNLVSLYTQDPKCLCILLEDSAGIRTGFVVNQTLAMQIPVLCELRANISICPGLLHLSPDSPDSKVFNGSVAHSPSPVSPAMALVPATNMQGSYGAKLKVGSILVFMVTKFVFIGI